MLTYFLFVGAGGGIWSPSGELENMGKDAVIDYLQMPEKVKNIEGKVDLLTFAMDKLVVKLTEALGNLSDVEDPKWLAEGQKKLGDYVR